MGTSPVAAAVPPPPLAATPAPPAAAAAGQPPVVTTVATSSAPLLPPRHALPPRVHPVIDDAVAASSPRTRSAFGEGADPPPAWPDPARRHHPHCHLHPRRRGSPPPGAARHPRRRRLPRRQPPPRQIRPERSGSGGHRRRRPGRLPRSPEHGPADEKRVPPAPSLRPHGFVGGRSGGGEAEEGGGEDGAAGACNTRYVNTSMIHSRFNSLFGAIRIARRKNTDPI